MIEFELKDIPEKNYAPAGENRLVIFDPEKKVATKIFFKPEDKPFKTASEEDLKNVYRGFRSEVKAYKKIWKSDSKLQEITPKFLGKEKNKIKIIHNLKDTYNFKPPKSGSVGKFAYKMEYIDGTFDKAHHTKFRDYLKDYLINNGFQHSSIIKVFCDYGLDAEDASVAINDEKGKIWVIDFKTKDSDGCKKDTPQ